MLASSLSRKSLIPVIEIFGPTVQGEGVLSGCKTMFVRMAGCDYRCSWCDSAFTWDGSERGRIRMLHAEEIWAELEGLASSRFRHVTLSGGNPALLPQLESLVQLLREHGVKSAVETQGSCWQDWLTEVDDVTISPKPPSSGMETDWGKLDRMIERLTEADRQAAVSLKVVVFDQADLEYAAAIHKRYPNVPFVLQTGNDQLGASDRASLAESLLKRYEWLVDAVSASSELNNVRVLPQLHALVWGNKRGV
ncbi:7-carboxy-7-deazaguanine synthase QueE [Paenibacillus thiaminolyticus]|uniref:7-carboxy-7-deazaguanine synthase n=1 Tax=Paenibacillus thiaminolyticus TaxID=49283 RepID=A0A3A3H805_PANTH|nr:7-carboxy-7-deazaguanine synthase QueE [Paenibacillus thiaminolyticus]RJG26166.1 7-carboxy-7-deazaguanine synthase QueE [Paenibacillus thiaminolyticus]